MKLATFVRGDARRIGVVHAGGTKLFDLRAAAEREGRPNPAFASMLSLIDADDAGLEAARSLFDHRSGEDDLQTPVSDAHLLAPVPEPRQMRDGMSFPLHILQAPRGLRLLRARAANDADAARAILDEPLGELPPVYRRVPIFYITNRFSVQGTGTTVRWPRYSSVMDYELELGLFTKRTAANIQAARAHEHIFGFTIFNDFSARDIQGIEMQALLGPAKGKSFDGGNVIGPWIVTPDEVGNPYRLAMEVRVNAETRSRATSEGMLFSFEEILAYVSKDETVHAGEFIGSGTVGNGCGLELGRFLEDGDRIELEVEKIGVLANRVERQAV